MGRWGGGGEHEHFHPTLANRRRIRLSLRLISSHGIPSRGHTCRPASPSTYAHTYVTHAHTFVWPRSIRQAPGEAISSIYRQRLHGSFAEPFPPFLLLSSCQAFGASGISRMRLDARARIYPAQTLRCIVRCTDILVADFSLSSFCRRRCTAFRASSIRIPGWQPSAPAPLNRKAAC